MKTFLTLWRKELLAYFLSPLAYVVMVMFLFLMGYSFWSLTDWLVEGVESPGIMQVLFGDSLFFWITMLVLPPVITMRLFAEEVRSGTIETLMTAPVDDTAVVLGKYAAALTLFVLMWLPTASYAFALRYFDPGVSIHFNALWTGFLGALLLGAFYLSVGLLASSLTRSLVVAAIMGIAMICAMFITGFVPYICREANIRAVGEYISALKHMQDFSRGIVDSRPIVFYLSATILVLFVTTRVVTSRRWK